VLFLDEPFEAIDPVSARTIRALLERYTAGGARVKYSTHMNAGIYGRLSQVRERADEQERQVETSIERQFRDCLDYAKGQGWEIARTYADEGISAYSGAQRPDFERLVSDVEAGTIQVVVCWKLDRLCRRPRDFERLWEVCERRGARLVSRHEAFDSSTPAGEFTIRLMISMAQMESANISIRVKSYMAAARRGGRFHTGGSRPYGYTYQGEIVPEEAEAIRETARRLLDGKPLLTIVGDLNQRGLKGTRGTPLRVTSVARALRSPRVAGLVSHDGAILGPGMWEPVLERDVWEQVRMALDDPLRRTSPGPERKHLLPGFVRCGIEGCGHKLFSRTFGREPSSPARVGAFRYICLQGDRAFGRLHLSIMGGPVDELVTERILDRLDRGGLAEVLATQDGSGDARALGEELVTLDARLLGLRKRLGQGLDPDDFAVAKSEITDRARHLRGQLAKLQARRDLAGLPTGPGELRRAWPDLTIPQRRVVVGLLLERVVILPADRKGRRRFNPDRVVIPKDAWRA
jgi:DNA invertase Pin-like site-specific DNA recombinase